VSWNPNQPFSFCAIRQVRLVALLLLASISWGATAEFTHSHGVRNQSALTQTGFETTSFDANESVQSSNQSSTSYKTKSAAECLICQLHQNLSNSLLGHAPAIASVETHSFACNPDLAFHRSDFSESQRDRAPPANL
jgi:hypothetical protein